MRTEFLCMSVLRVALGPRVKLASCKSALTTPAPPRPTPTMVYSTDRSKAVVLVLVLLFCCFVVYSTRRFVLVLPGDILFLFFFSPFSIAITSLGEERANLSVFCTFVWFELVWFCRVWEWLRLVIVALPGLFSYLFFRSQITYSFVKCGLFFSSIPQSDMSRLEYLEVFQRVPLTLRYIAFHVFIVHLFLFCWFIGKTVYSEYFRESFGVRDNESRLYFKAL